MKLALFLFLVALGPSAVVAATAPQKWDDAWLKLPREWYASAEARIAADAVLGYQSEFGAWPKNTNLLEPATPTLLAEIIKSGKANTIDNNATTVPMEFLALVYEANHDTKYRDAVVRGIRYLLESQYPNGGFPQFYPLRSGYYSHITYNDGAMINTLETLRDVAARRPPYGFVGDELRRQAETAVVQGIDCILKTQIKQAGRLTAWCAQHDATTLEPAWARKYEPPSLSGGETVGIVRFLISIPNPSSEIIAAVHGAVAWLGEVRLHGVRLDYVRRDDGRAERVIVNDPAAPSLWARFYELGTNRPLFLDRDSVFHYDFSEIGYERRSGYSYYGTWATSLLAKDYPRWRSKLSAF
jgi:PelA/Pel-15E family pectate lyase